MAASSLALVRLVPGLVALLCASCIIGPQRFTLQLPGSLTARPVAGADQVKLKFEVTDARAQKEHCGRATLGGLSARSTVLVSVRPVTVAVAQALDARARALGYQVAPDGVAVTVALDEVVNRFYMSLTEVHSEGTVRFLARIDAGGRARYLKLVEGFAERTELIALPEIAELTLNASLRDAVDALLSDPGFLSAAQASSAGASM